MRSAVLELLKWLLGFKGLNDHAGYLVFMSLPDLKSVTHFKTGGANLKWAIGRGVASLQSMGGMVNPTQTIAKQNKTLMTL